MGPAAPANEGMIDQRDPELSLEDKVSYPSTTDPAYLNTVREWLQQIGNTTSRKRSIEVQIDPHRTPHVIAQGLVIQPAVRVQQPTLGQRSNLLRHC